MAFRLLDLPLEIRECIYGQVLQPRIRQTDNYPTYAFDLTLARTNKQVRHELLHRLHADNTFIAVTTPWEKAPALIQSHEQIPIVATESAADSWPATRLTCLIDLPLAGYEGAAKFIIHEWDLKKFCNHWFYQALSLRDLNTELRLTLTLRNTDGHGLLPVQRQRDLVQPFGRIKELQSTVIKGATSTVEKELRDSMQVPLKSPTECLEESFKLKDQGNLALKANKPEEALRLYLDAFKAVHMVIVGRERFVYGDAFFQAPLDRPFENDSDGRTVYFRMRVRLVANVMMAYLKMEQWDEAQFWGSRSISLLREIAGSFADMPNNHIPGLLEWGKVRGLKVLLNQIYYRTGVAAERLDNMTLASEMYRIAHAWLPQDHNVTEAMKRLSSGPARMLI